MLGKPTFFLLKSVRLRLALQWGFSIHLHTKAFLSHFSLFHKTTPKLPQSLFSHLHVSFLIHFSHNHDIDFLIHTKALLGFSSHTHTKALPSHFSHTFKKAFLRHFYESFFSNFSHKHDNTFITLTPKLSPVIFLTLSRKIVQSLCSQSQQRFLKTHNKKIQ